MGSYTTKLSTPKFEELPLRPGDPKASAWGVWGNDDELGTLNLLTLETVKYAAGEIQSGERVPLNLAIDAFLQPMNPVRKPCNHHIINKGNANDDELHINTQGSSHWDGLRHYPYQQTLQYYNGASQSDISGPLANSRIGIQNLAQNPILGRGVLLDWAAWADIHGIEYDAFCTHAIPLSQLQAVASWQGVGFRRGDILLIRTGWLAAFNKLGKGEQLALPRRLIRSSMGVEASEENIRWHWENGFSAVASDTVAYEAWPSPKPWGVAMHEVFLSGWGMPIGESFDLELLAKRCQENRRWCFFFMSVPLNVPAGVASPANAVAVL
ncbi:hypothetical protein NQ176_g888 [Zarea fungicola]|uniref:Uncharacterized protein n=1 Tax=Zarea fungicola TaxID=93591 RepID=A0ACC1NWK8_9HYPO|nr:hypothetical protein NQ176_g888 [Lecanicillium fungicola]